MNTQTESRNEEHSTEARRGDAFLAKAFPNRRLRRILFVQPPDADSTIFNYATGKRGRYFNYPPYGLGLLAEQSRRRGAVVDIVNLNNEILKSCRTSRSADEFDFDRTWRAALRRAIEAFVPDMIGFTCMFSQTHKSLVAACLEARRIAPDTPLAAGGVHITNSLANAATAPKMLEDLSCVEFLFRFEADNAFQTFVDVVNDEKPLSELAQVVFNERGAPVHFEARTVPSGSVLDTVPAHDLLTPTELGTWGKIGSFFCHKPPETRFTTVLANRGCRAQCTFCSVRNFNGVGVRRRSVESVIDELKMLKNEYGIGHIMWLDDDFLYNHKESLNLFNAMVRENIGMTWDCTNGVIAASCTDEIISAAEASGCIGLNIGMESGNRDILRRVRKPGTVENFLAAAETLRRFENINTRVFLMIGFPGETYRQVLDTIDVARQMDLDWYNVSTLQPLPNTPIFDEMLAMGLLNDVEFSDIRCNAGGYGKNNVEIRRRGTDLLATDFKNAFAVQDLDEIPSKAGLDDIWAYMNFHLNFNRLFFEGRPVKLRQHISYVENITEVIAPENAIAMYFLGYLQHKLHGSAAAETIERLEDRLRQSPYWIDRFRDFRLSVQDLRAGRFEPQAPDAALRQAS